MRWVIPMVLLAAILFFETGCAASCKTRSAIIVGSAVMEGTKNMNRENLFAFVTADLLFCLAEEKKAEEQRGHTPSGALHKKAAP